MTWLAQFHSSLAAIGRDDWERLRRDDHPFLAWDFLHGLERHACLQPRYGWTPHHLALFHHGRLVGAVPLYLKANSHGEFVFDQNWAQAWQRHGRRYYPKLLAAVPYSPVPGARLLRAVDAPDDTRTQLCAALVAETDRLGLSSCHINFHHAEEVPSSSQWLPRFDWQFHWHQRGWTDFNDFLAALTSKKRKNILQERAQVARSGIRIRCLEGGDIDASSMDAMIGFYLDTFDRKGNLPALSAEFFHHLRTTMPEQLLLVLAERGGMAIAGALFLHSRSTLYGRYWGARETHPGLHFELCYYQGIEYCLRRGLQHFEPGAQGEHKIARGFLPARTHSSHYLADTGFRAAVADALRDEAQWLEQYATELRQHSPYRQIDPATTVR